MTLPIQSFPTIINNQYAAMQSQSALLMDSNPGSELLAFIEANAANSIWIQSLVSALLAVTRLQTSTGNDVDTFINAFGDSRAASVAATGNLTFSRSVTTSISSIPAASTVVGFATSNVQFTTTVDTTLSTYDPTTNSYLMGIGIASIIVPAKCNTPGVIGNVTAGSINTLVNPPTNVNAVTNAAAFANGADTESDSSTITGFPLYLAGLSKATQSALDFAVSGVDGVAKFASVENKSETNVTQLGFFYYIVDNGSGTAGTPLVDLVKNAIQPVRGLTIMFDVIPAGSFPVTITMSVLASSVPAQAGITTAVKAALIAYVQTLAISTFTAPSTLYYTRIAEITYDASPNVINVTNVVLNSGIVDKVATANTVFTLLAANITINYI